MNGSKWEQSQVPGPLLKYLRGKASDRKLRLFACAIARMLPPSSPGRDRLLRWAIETAEAFADGAKVQERMQRHQKRDWVVTQRNAYTAAEGHFDQMLSDRKAEMADVLRCV